MEETESSPFDQEKAYILATCTALGGFEDRQVGPDEFVKVYSLGDQALGCLKDLKAAIRAQAQSPVKTFLAAMYEYNLLENDLVPIIQLHKNDRSEVGLRFVLACVELLVPMTWPLEKPKHMDDEEYDPNQMDRYRKFKKALLEPDVLETIMYLLVGPLSTPYRERSTYDHTIIRLVLYLFRNLTVIPDLNASQSVTGSSADLTNLQEKMVLRFAEVGVLELLLVIGSNSMEAGVAEWNVIVLEMLYNILRHVQPREVFILSEQQRQGHRGGSLTEKLSHLLDREKTKVRLQHKDLPSRHSRFGGTYAVHRNDGRRYVFHKQTAGYRNLGVLIDAEKKPDMRGRKRKEMDEVNVHITYRNREALKRLKEMARGFLENSFNSFYRSIRRDIEREDPKITEKDYPQYFYTMQWFLEYLVFEKTAQDKRKEKEQNDTPSEEALLLPLKMPQTAAKENEETSSEDKQDGFLFDYDLAATALDLTTCLLCLRRLRDAIDKKIWLDAQVSADCLRQMLTIIGNMAVSENQEHKDVAEYIQSNIFHESTNLDVIVDLIRRYKNQSYGYLTSAVQLVHIVLRTLEKYANKKQVFFVRKGRKGLTSRKSQADGEDVPESDPENDDDDEEERTPTERIFRFEQFEKKFATYDVIQVYCTLLERYQELDQGPLHAIVSLFHRIMVKRGVEHIFWKLPILNLFSLILTDARYMQPTPALKQLVEFINYCTRQFFKRAKDYPLLFVEALFINANVGRITDD